MKPSCSIDVPAWAAVGGASGGVGEARLLSERCERLRASTACSSVLGKEAEAEEDADARPLPWISGGGASTSMASGGDAGVSSGSADTKRPTYKPDLKVRLSWRGNQCKSAS
jgi:hypothetical protein